MLIHSAPQKLEKWIASKHAAAIDACSYWQLLAALLIETDLQTLSRWNRGVEKTNNARRTYSRTVSFSLGNSYTNAALIYVSKSL